MDWFVMLCFKWMWLVLVRLLLSLTQFDCLHCTSKTQHPIMTYSYTYLQNNMTSKMKCGFYLLDITKCCTPLGHCSTFMSVCFYRIIEANNNSPPLTFKRFQAIVSRLELPRRPLPPISQQQMDRCRTNIADNHNQQYSIPSLEELGTYLSFHWKGPTERQGVIKCGVYC